VVDQEWRKQRSRVHAGLDNGERSGSYKQPTDHSRLAPSLPRLLIADDRSGTLSDLSQGRGVTDWSKWVGGWGRVSRADYGPNLVGLTLNMDGDGCWARNACEPWGNCWYAIGGASVCRFTATGSYDDGSTQDVSGSVAWSSSSPGAMTMSGNVGYAESFGWTTITGSVGNVSASQLLFVGF
jgi:hypothetical protein